MRTKGPGQATLLLLDVIAILNKFHVSYAIIGAFAASFYGVIRASMDADAAISLPRGQADVARLLDALRQAGLTVTYRKGDLHDPIGAVINAGDRFNNRVDLLMDIRGTTSALFSRAIDAKFMKTRIRVIGIEDFIATKMLAGSPKDLQDVAGALKVSSDRIDLPLLRTLVKAQGSDAVRKLGSLLQANTK